MARIKNIGKNLLLARNFPVSSQIALFFTPIQRQVGTLALALALYFLLHAIQKLPFWDSLYFQPANIAPTEGIITQNTLNDSRTAFLLYFTYPTPDGKTHETATISEKIDMEKGTKVRVWYVKNHPEIAILAGEGMSRHRRGLVASFIAVVIFAGIWWSVFFMQWKNFVAGYSLLLWGKVAPAHIHYEQEWVENDKKHALVPYYLFFDENDDCEYKFKTTFKEIDEQGYKAEERIIYNDDMSYTLLLKQIPGKITLDSQGFIHGKPLKEVFPLLIIPALSLLLLLQKIITLLIVTW